MRQKQTRHAQGKGASLASGQRGPLLYRLEDTPAIGKRLLYSLQFVVIFMGSVVLVPMLVAEPLGWSQEQVAFLLQCAIFTGGIATFVQAKGIGPVGARLPILLGTTFVTITPLVAITTEYGYDAFLGGVIAGGIVYVLVACFGTRFLRRFFSSTVSGTLVVAIALTLAPSCADMAAGGSAPVGGGYGTWQNWLLAILTMAICLIAHLFGKGFWRTIGLFMGLAAGYVLALLLGDVAFGGVMEAAWFSVPRPFVYGVSPPGARSDYGGHLSRYGDGICGRHDSHCHGLCRPFVNPSGAAGRAALRRPVQRAVWGVQFRTEHLLQRRRGDHRQHPCSQPSRDGDQRPSDRRCGVGSQVCSVAVHSAGACVGRGVPLPHWVHVDGRR